MSCEGNAMIMLLYFRPGIEQVQMRKDVSAACKKGELEIKDNGFSKAGPVVLGCIEGIYYGLNWMPSPMFEVLRDKYLKEKCTK